MLREILMVPALGGHVRRLQPELRAIVPRPDVAGTVRGLATEAPVRQAARFAAVAGIGQHFGPDVAIPC